MMKKNVWKVLKLAVLSLAVIVVFILLFLQCPEDKTTRETSDDSSLPVSGLVKEMTGEAEKQNLSATLDIAKPEKKINKSAKQLQVVGMEPVQGTAEKVKVKHERISLHANNADKPVLHEKTHKAVSGQKGEAMEETHKLKEEMKVLSEKVDVLLEKVRVLMERVEAILGKVKTEAPDEDVTFIIAEDQPNPDKGNETLAKDEEVFKYPTHVLAGGISTYKDWTGYGLQGSYAYRLNKYISLGLQGNAFFKEGKYRGDRSLYAGVRANFHIFPLLVENSNFDLYAGGSLGAGRDNNVMTLEAMGCMGVSYDFCKHWGVFAEAGNIGVFGLRLKF